MDAPRAEPTMPVAAVARRLGVAPSTLRTWDRRYGLGPGRHIDGKHRRYGPADIARLELMQRALLRGASTAEAARYCLDQLPKSVPPPAESPTERAAGSPAWMPEPATTTPPARPAPEPAISEPPDSTMSRRLRTSALALDAGAVQRVLAAVIAEAGVLPAWEKVIQPLLGALGAGWPGTKAGVEVEYLLAECVLGALVRATPVLDCPRNQRPVLLSCVPRDGDGLPLYALAASLADRRIATQLFGRPPTPDVLAATIRRSAPAAVVLRAHESGAADVRLFADDPRGRPRRRMFAWGPGWRRAPLPAQVEPLADLRAAVDRLEYVLLGQ